MSRAMGWSLVLAAFVALTAAAAPARGAGSEGQEDLDKATKLKMTATSMKDLAEVIRLCENARKKGLDPDNDTFAKSILASTLMQRGATLGRAVFEASNATPAWTRVRDMALADLNRALEVDPQQPEGLYYVARLNLLPGGDAKRAADALGRLIALKDVDAELRSKALVLHAEMQDDLKKKEADLDEAVRLDPREPSAVLARAVFLAEHGDADKALTELKKAADLQPERSAPYEAMAIVLARQKKYDQALVAIDHAHERSPESPYPLLQRAKIHALGGNYDAALHDLNQAAALNPDDPETLLLRAHVYQQKKENDKAQADLDHVLRVSPGLASALQFRAGLLASEGKFDLAVAELEKLRREKPVDVATLLEIGMLYSAAHEDGRAIAVYNQVLQADPKNYAALRGRAYAALASGHHAPALSDFEAAYRQNDNDSELLNNFAWLLSTSPSDKLRDGARAVKLATKSCELTKFKSPHILSTLAASYAETGDFAKAIEYSTKAVAAGEPDMKAELQKELDSYKAHKPWRELQTEGKTENQPAAPASHDKPAKK